MGLKKKKKRDRSINLLMYYLYSNSIDFHFQVSVHHETQHCVQEVVGELVGFDSWSEGKLWFLD